MNTKIKLAALAALFSASPLLAQEPVVGHPDPESLFTSDDPQLHANKQVALRVMRELLQCNHWDEAGNWLTERYLQHNPNVSSGLAPVQAFFGQRPRTPTCDRLETPVVAVTAEDDLVTVMIAREYDDPRNPGQKYTTTWYDTWRIVDGKADEHWDPATIAAR
jgi:predicted SnoaL-like aldol condensation-catalyzing enzyme